MRRVDKKGKLSRAWKRHLKKIGKWDKARHTGAFAIEVLGMESGNEMGNTTAHV